MQQQEKMSTCEACAEWAKSQCPGTSAKAVEDALRALLLADEAAYASDRRRLAAAYDRLGALISAVYEANPSKRAYKALMTFLLAEPCMGEMRRQFPSELQTWRAKLNCIRGDVEHWQGFERQEEKKLAQIMKRLK